MGNKSSLMLQDGEIIQISEETGFSPAQIEKLFSRFAHLDRGNCGSLNKNDLMSIPELAINPLCDRLIQMFFEDCDQDERINFKQFMRVLATFRSNANNNNTNVGYVTGNPDLSKNGITVEKSHSRNHSRDLTPSISRNNSSTNLNTMTNRHHHQAPNDSNKINETVDKALSTIGNNKNGNYNTNSNNRINDGLRNKLLFVFRVYDADDDGKISFNDLRSILKMMVGNYIEDVQLDKIASRALVEVDEDNDGFIGFNEFCKVFNGKDLDDKLRVKFFN